MKVSIPHPDRNIVGRIELSRRSDGRFLAFIGNAHGTCGRQDVIGEEDIGWWLEDARRQLHERVEIR